MPVLHKINCNFASQIEILKRNQHTNSLKNRYSL